MKKLTNVLLISAFVVLFFGWGLSTTVREGYTGHHYRHANQQHKDITYTLSAEQVGQASSIQLTSPNNQNMHLDINFDFAEQDGITLTHHVREFDEANFFDISKTKIIHNNGITHLAFDESDMDLSYHSFRVTVTLPRRDWYINVSKWFFHNSRFTNKGKPMNLTVIANKPHFYGHFSQVTVWQTTTRKYHNYYDMDEIKLGKVSMDKLTVYSKPFRLRVDKHSDIGQIDLHSTAEGKFKAYKDVSILNKISWQPLQKDELELLNTFQPKPKNDS